MGDASITASAVKVTNNTKKQSGRYGATVAAGEVVYGDSTDNGDLKLADADNTSATADVKGMALNGGADGQPGEIATDGDVTMDGLTAGTVYVLSGTPGKIAPVADLAIGDIVVVIGVATSATNLRLCITNSEYELA